MNTYPYVEARNQGGRQRRPSAILIKTSWTTSDKGAALGIAMRQNQKDAPLSASHFTVDEAEIFQCVPAKVSAGSDSHRTKNLLEITACFDPSIVQYGWEQETHVQLLDQLSSLTAQLVKNYKIRPRLLDRDEFGRWLFHRSRRRGGIFVEFVDVPWPGDEFIDQVMKKRKEY